MPALQVRNCPPDIYGELNEIAQESGCSLTRAAILVMREGLDARSEKIKEELRMRKRQDAFAAFDQLNRLRSESAGPDPVDAVREARADRMHALDDIVAETIPQGNKQ